ncbi:hypothetical protein A3A95_03915 [Candidatus Nomurabacteria bacterium RIFCSPLOWO2_01_FULL_39_18]|uniref:D-alanyl-D-alanine carboxypeptidase-like core domain-containing protein n=1 Tax=Candidatus Nomurabacteria bacterium RIFCSPHIGHO2_01_FULL_40_24b TaxID=1801739 RepID=A0A1F6V6E0_9BACT|nr:MAG: hypothetical protein A2647_04605 [Candidatus Nomurabacteria bacterium RIFCSPHIGHO2_01_FULL_40_24b]OGI89253.1 MAG: hypothetical protein A3A95_03915 [Candidatus Nomurabacteria bacterium RIFCSPLOWO2_01_FULL_39_18]
MNPPEITMNKDNSLQSIPRIIFFLLMITLVVYSSSLSIRYRREEQIKKIESEKKIYLTGKFEPSEREDFVLISPENAFGANDMYLRKEAYGTFILMREAAKEDGIDLKIASATRNFDYQKNIWDEKWAELEVVDGKNIDQEIPDGLRRFKKILEFSSAPGTSRHHWGSDIDINRVNPLYAGSARDEIEREKIYAWLVKNAAQFGFCQTYTLKNEARKTGYKEERWHWSYLPLSKALTQEYKILVKNEDIKGFSGDEFVSTYDLVNNYVLAINPDCI